LMQGEFKAVYVETNEQLIHLSRYIHINPLVGYVTKDLNKHPWSSYQEYMSEAKFLCSKEIVMDQFRSKGEYEQFVLDQEDYGKKLESIKHQLLDYPRV
ncbi:MAG TPA: hypothetical protein VNA13_03970, partial [Xanthomonadales bacterium]|nr:hypothetical protein [Xanthomonadales bacterium]